MIFSTTQGRREYGTDDHIVEERGLVVGLADKSGDGSCLKVGIDRGIDLDKIIVSLEGFDKRSEVKMRLGRNHFDRSDRVEEGIPQDQVSML
jgi:hypothetical protein